MYEQKQIPLKLKKFHNFPGILSHFPNKAKLAKALNCSLASNPNPISLSDSGKTFSFQFSFLSLRSTLPFHRSSYLYILNSLTLNPCLFPENLTFFFFFQKRNCSFLLKLACQIFSWNFHSFLFYNFVAFSAAKHIFRVSLNSVTFCCLVL